MAEGYAVPSSLEDEIRQTSSNVRTLLVKLFGEVDDERPTGRIPMLEDGHKNHAKRLASLERSRNAALAIIGFAGFVVSLLEAWTHWREVVR